MHWGEIYVEEEEIQLQTTNNFRIRIYDEDEPDHERVE